jgi:hypothetical protein
VDAAGKSRISTLRVRSFMWFGTGEALRLPSTGSVEQFMIVYGGK